MTILQWTKTTSVISRCGTFSPLFYFRCFQVISLFQVLKVQDYIHFECNSIFSFIYIYTYWWIVFIYFSKAFPKGGWVNLACFIICFWLDGNTSLPVRYSCLSNLPYNKADISAASLLISYCCLSSLIWSSIVMILLYIERIFSKS